LIADDKNMSDVVRSPVLAREVQARAVGAILARLSVHDLTRKFVMLLAEKRRLFVLPTINHAFGKLLANLRGEMTAEVTSAQPLKDAQIVALKGVLKDTYKRDVRLDTKVDPALIGGFILKAASRQIDTSLRSKLKALESAMKGS
jgi:F-type H+-transporting ATPase subunit delta